MLSLLTGAAMSASEVARELDISQANASYHLRVLARAGQITEVGEEKIRGGVAKRYRYGRHAGQGAPAAGAHPSPSEGHAFREAIATELTRRSRLAAPGGLGYTSDVETWVTADVWRQVRDLVQEASALIHDEAQPPRTEGTLHVTMTAMLFELQARDSQPQPPAGADANTEVTDKREGEA